MKKVGTRLLSSFPLLFLCCTVERARVGCFLAGVCFFSLTFTLDSFFRQPTTFFVSHAWSGYTIRGVITRNALCPVGIGGKNRLGRGEVKRVRLKAKRPQASFFFLVQAACLGTQGNAAPLAVAGFLFRSCKRVVCVGDEGATRRSFFVLHLAPLVPRKPSVRDVHRDHFPRPQVEPDEDFGFKAVI